MMWRATRGGFTLIEVVLAIALALLLVAALLAFYRQTEDIHAAVSREVDVISTERTVMDHMTTELRCSMPYPQAGITFQGTNTGMRFTTTVLPGPEAWAVPTSIDSQVVPTGSDLEIVGYDLALQQDDDGNTVIAGLERTSQRHLVAVAVDGVDIVHQLLAPQMQFLRLAYWDGSAWQDSWTASGMPAAVEIILGNQPIPDGVDPADYPYAIYRRVVAVPAGATAAPSGTIILGLDGGPMP